MTTTKLIAINTGLRAYANPSQAGQEIKPGERVDLTQHELDLISRLSCGDVRPLDSYRVWLAAQGEDRLVEMTRLRGLPYQNLAQARQALAGDELVEVLPKKTRRKRSSKT